MRKKRKAIGLPLTPFVDVFSILVIYLLVGTYFAPADIVLPKDLSLPISRSLESPELAPQVLMSKQIVSIPSLKYSLPIEQFLVKGASGDHIAEFQSKVSEMVKAMAPELRQNGVTINFIADKDLPYVAVFNVLQALRVREVDNILFLARGL